MSAASVQVMSTLVSLYHVLVRWERLERPVAAPGAVESRAFGSVMLLSGWNESHSIDLRNISGSTLQEECQTARPRFHSFEAAATYLLLEFENRRSMVASLLMLW